MTERFAHPHYGFHIFFPHLTCCVLTLLPLNFKCKEKKLITKRKIRDCWCLGESLAQLCFSHALTNFIVVDANVIATCWCSLEIMASMTELAKSVDADLIFKNRGEMFA
ncbi:hypothetical protein XENOCAPTIV_022258 [Xenoophorus captivus]|uniref:Uncharacterized protein n=1 Tax=Xenoophorus captivus TaxID=1517983 RepID=A0ABV0R2X8_9TELE